MNKTRKILWKKWEDPFLPLLLNEQPQEDDEDYDPLRLPHQSHGFGPTLSGPMGIIPLRESNLPSKAFNFWMGHSNFNLDAFFRDIVSQVDGVESLEIYTRYRFRLGIGKLFDDRQVRQEIDHLFSSPGSRESDRNQLNGMVKALQKRGGNWAVYCLDGKLQIVAGEAMTVEGTLELVKRAGGQCVARSG